MSASVCRVCLSGEVRMHSVKDAKLLEIYEKLADAKLNIDKSPNTLCYICYSQLQRCARFSDIAHRSEKILQDLLHSGREVTPVNLLGVNSIQNLHKTTTLSLDLLKNEGYREYNYINIHDSTPLYDSIPVSIKEEEIEIIDVKSEKEFVKQETWGDDTNGYDDMKKNYDSDSDEPLKRKNDNSVDNMEPFHCHQCKKKFKQLKNLEIHMRIHTKEKLFPCTICSKSFILSSHLKRHLKRHSDAGPKANPDLKPFCCDRCSKNFKHSCQLRSHMRTHTGEQPFACETCGKKFNQIGNLVLHRKIHTAEKSFSCEKCGRMFLLKCQLKSHYLTHSDEKPHSCNRCAMTFTFKSALNQHIRRIHAQVKPYPCQQCGRSFDQECSLTRHLKIHSAERVYTCHVCNKGYTKAETLKRHILIHSEETPYSCERCNKAFKVMRYLLQHKAICKAQVFNQNAVGN